KQQYHTENPNAFLKMASLPAFNNTSGNVILLSNNVRIDQLDYTEKMHFPMIKNPKGVSLERSSLKRPTNDSGNFRSAAASVGFATPGYKNSQFLDEPSLTEEFSLLSKTFSPDNDGFEDQLQINYRLDKPGYVANINIFNDKGILVRKLCRNLTLALAGSFNWDGLNDFAELSPTGIYLIYAELFDLDGQVKRFRKTCVLASKLSQ
ncbi:MAG TPA: hypothetical protein VEV16_07765, partial [Daejeonella sp.]|nr:hypothetical protein [Daejeonella sp.]